MQLDRDNFLIDRDIFTIDRDNFPNGVVPFDYADELKKISSDVNKICQSGIISISIDANWPNYLQSL